MHYHINAALAREKLADRQRQARSARGRQPAPPERTRWVRRWKSPNLPEA
jgi:hypothetical protein